MNEDPFSFDFVSALEPASPYIPEYAPALDVVDALKSEQSYSPGRGRLEQLKAMGEVPSFDEQRQALAAGADSVSDGTYPKTPQIGKAVSVFESGTQGPSAIGRDRTGGWSYGTYQFAAGGTKNNGEAFKAFLETAKQVAPEAHSVLEAAGGAKAARAGTQAFRNAWAQASAMPGFNDAEYATIKTKLYDPVVAQVRDKTGLDHSVSSPAIQEMLWSMAVQHPPGAVSSIVSKALKGQDPTLMSDKDVLNKIYDERSKVDIYFRSSTPAVKQSVADRFTMERAKVLSLLPSSSTQLAME